MPLTTMITRSIRPNSGAKVLGVGRGSGSTLTDLFKMGAGAAQIVDLRGRSDAAAGLDARCLYARLHQYGQGGGEAVRAYAFAQNAATAAGGTLNGLHASLSVATSSAISGAGNAARLTLEAASATRTLGGTCAALRLDSNIGANNTVPASWAFMAVGKVGSVDLSTFLSIEDDQCIKGNGNLDAITTGDALKVRGPAGQEWYIPLVAKTS